MIAIPTRIPSITALLVFSHSTLAQVTEAIHLTHGIYVVNGTSCKDAPFAAMSIWDGFGFGGPHESHCQTKVLHQQGAAFDVATTCSAQGDGTPTKPSTLNAWITVLGAESYSILPLIGTTKSEVPATAIIYRWCSANSGVSAR